MNAKFEIFEVDRHAARGTDITSMYRFNKEETLTKKKNIHNVQGDALIANGEDALFSLTTPDDLGKAPEDTRHYQIVLPTEEDTPSYKEAMEEIFNQLSTPQREAIAIYGKDSSQSSYGPVKIGTNLLNKKQKDALKQNLLTFDGYTQIGEKKDFEIANKDNTLVIKFG